MANLFLFVLSIAVLSVHGYVTTGSVTTGPVTTEGYNATTTENPLDTFPGMYYMLYRWAGYEGQKTNCIRIQYLPVEKDLQCKCAERKELDVMPAIKIDKYHPDGHTVVVDFVGSRAAIGKAAYETCTCNLASSNGPWNPPRIVRWKIQKGFFIESLLGERFPMFELWSKVIPEPEELETIVKSVESLKNFQGHVICRQEDMPTTVKPTTEESSHTDD